MDSTATIFDPNRFSEKATNSRLTQVWTALPGIIQKFDAGALTCEVRMHPHVPDKSRGRVPCRIRFPGN